MVRLLCFTHVLFSFLCLYSQEEFLVESQAVLDGDNAKQHALYLMRQNRIEESMQRYRESVLQTGRYDFEVLQKMGLILLEKGIQSEDPQIYFMTLIGAGLSGSFGALDILEKGLDHPDPQIQLVSLHFISQFNEDKTTDLLNKAMSSNHLSTRMEAAFYMALKKHPLAVGQIEGLMSRLPPVFKPYFPPFFALIGTADANATLRRLLEDPDPQVRVESILNTARSERDDFLPLLRKKLFHFHIAELEASAFAVGILKDSSSLGRLKKLANSSNDSVKIAAGRALFHLGDRSCVPVLENLAQKHNLFAISVLGEIDGTESVLKNLLQSEDFHVRINAAISLLHLKDPACLEALLDILIMDVRSLAFQPLSSLGRTQMSLKAIPSAELRSKDPTLNLGFSLAIREQLLKETIQLPEAAFLKIAKVILERHQNDLVPTLIHLLENLRTDGAIELLKMGTRKLTSPLIRDYCYLSLYRLKQEGPYEEYINYWVMHQKEADLIQLRPPLSWEYRLEQPDYTLTPNETSHLLIESFLSIANQRDEKSIAFLLEAIQLGNPINRYALMGLLMRATE